MVLRRAAAASLGFGNHRQARYVVCHRVLVAIAGDFYQLEVGDADQ